ncbi:hypothetical protein QYF36_013179 [Acer negundo]|nr:hypothetical protein QYF36_013179 [Acer negundo]
MLKDLGAKKTFIEFCLACNGARERERSLVVSSSFDHIENAYQVDIDHEPDLGLEKWAGQYITCSYSPMEESTYTQRFRTDEVHAIWREKKASAGKPSSRSPDRA